MEVLQFTLRGSFGHYKRLEGSTVRQTHTVPPKTALDGLIAGILGLDRDSYYEEFYNNNTVAVVPLSIRKQSIPQLFVSTKPSQMRQLGANSKAPDHTENRQRPSIEYLLDPEYQIYLSPPEKYTEELKNRLNENRYVFSPCLGTSECLAQIDYYGEITLDETETDEVHSVVTERNNTTVNSTEKVSFERFVTGFELTTSSRKPKGFVSATVPLEKTTVTVDTDRSIYTDGQYNILFY